MLICRTENCEMGAEQHYPHPDGIPVICGLCGKEMTEADA